MYILYIPTVWRFNFIYYNIHRGELNVLNYSYFKKTTLLRREIIKRDVGGVRVLADQHGMSMTECATPHILSAEPHVEALIEQATDGHRFSCSPVDV